MSRLATRENVLPAGVMPCGLSRVHAAAYVGVCPATFDRMIKTASGVMTAIGGLGHALLYLISSFWTPTIIALIVVFIELWVTAWI